MSNARNLSKLLGTDTQITTADIADAAFQANKNLIINGAMAVNQRNSTGQPVGNYGYGVDRWRGYNNGTARYDVSQESVTDLEGFSYCYKLAVTTAQSSYGSDISVPIEQSMEGYTTAHLSFGTSNARTVTISFYVKSSVTGDFSCALFNGSPITRSIVQNWTVNTADTWEYKTITFAGDTSGTWRTDNLVGAYVALAGIGGSAGTARASAANTWEAGYKNHLSTSDNIFATNSATLRFTGIQIEVGSTATPFEHRSFGDELARCQRYYEKSYPYSVAPGTAISYPGNLGITVRGMDEETSGQRYITNTMRVEKRADPTNTFYDDAGNSGKVTTFNNAGTGTNNVSIGLVVTQPSMIGCGPGNSAIWGFGFFYESDAEL